MTNRGKIVFLGNCQVSPLKNLWNNANTGLSADSLNVNLVKSEVDRMNYMEKLENADIVVTQYLSESFQNLSTVNVKSVAKQMLIIPNIFYRGWHPDMTYLGLNGKRIKGVTGDYHSLICVLLSLGKCSGDNLERDFEGLFDVFMKKKSYSEISKKSLESRFDSTNLSFAEFEERVGFEVPFMWTFNHPHNRALWELLRQIMKIIGVPFFDSMNSVVDFTYSNLSKDIVWSPVKSPTDFLSRRFYSLDGIKILNHFEFVNQSVRLMNDATIGLGQIRREDLSESDLMEILRIDPSLDKPQSGQR
jgi:hypothetical protein